MSNDYNEDEELILLVNEDVEEAKNELLKKYYFIIPYYIKKYNNIIKALEINNKELTEELMITLVQGLNFYSELKAASLKTYLNICIERKIRRCIEIENTEKRKTEKSIISLDKYYNETGNKLIELISDNNANPELIINQEEEYNILIKKIYSKLSNEEKKVFNYLIEGFNYHEISNILQKSTKSIDNAIQRIKNKLKKLL